MAEYSVFGQITIRPITSLSIYLPVFLYFQNYGSDAYQRESPPFSVSKSLVYPDGYYMNGK